MGVIGDGTSKYEHRGMHFAPPTTQNSICCCVTGGISEGHHLLVMNFRSHTPCSAQVHFEVFGGNEGRGRSLASP